MYLHYVFDLWAEQWRRCSARGDMILVRFADDWLAGFERHGDAARFLADLHERLAKFGLELHPDKTRLIEFGRFAARNRARRGIKLRPETFEFLGFTHQCATDRRGRFKLRRVTSKKRLRRKLQAVKTELRYRRHDPDPRTRTLAQKRPGRALPLLRGARQHQRAASIPRPGTAPLAPRAQAPQPALRRDPGEDAPHRR